MMVNKKNKTALIIGAGPAGLTVAYELLHRTDIKPIILEATNDIGGISKTVNYKGNRIDIGGHRFFTKSVRVNNFWDSIMDKAFPVVGNLDRVQKKYVGTDNESLEEKQILNRMLTRSRVSRIYYQKKFFDYPISLSAKTFRDLGLLKTIKIIVGFFYVRLFPVKEEKSLENFFINRFGPELYKTFFKSYTEKLWGMQPSEISSEWGAQRVKGISLVKIVLDSLTKAFGIKKDGVGETSLIEKFQYPALGPGQLWEKVAEEIVKKGGAVVKDREVVQLNLDGKTAVSVKAKNSANEEIEYNADVFFSTMPLKDLTLGLNQKVPKDIKEIAENLPYRDFITVGLLYKNLDIQNKTSIKTLNNRIPDNWLYVHEPEVKMCRIQIFNNWSPFMVKDESTVWIGLEYVCEEKDTLWKMADSEIIATAKKEIEAIGIAKSNQVLDSVVIKVKKAYPAYFGSYKHFAKLRKYFDSIENLYLIGRNGMHRYNNQDHSMLTAMVAVDSLLDKNTNKSAVWDVNTEEEYHEEKNGESK